MRASVGAARSGCSSSQQSEAQPFDYPFGTIMKTTKSISIILLLMAALLLGTIASIHAQSQPRLRPMSVDNSTGPHNPHQRQDEPAARRRA
jgi:hypothetical protein